MPEPSNKVPAASPSPPSPPSPLPPPLPMSEALEFWQQKIQLTPTAFYRLAEAQRVRAFTVSGLARADMLTLIHQGLETALQDGITLEQFKKNLANVWEESGWTGHKAWRIDNIFRTNLQTAYNVGRYKQMAEVAEDRPYWQYSAVNDSRTRPTHRALHGKVYRHDSPFWDTWYPPNGFRCRCKVKTLSAEDVRARGLAVEEYLKDDLIEPKGEHGPMPARPLRPDAGFAGNPGKEAWQPDLSRYPDWLRRKLEARLGTPSTSSIPPVPATPPLAETPTAGLQGAVPEFSTTREASAWAVANNVVDHADFTGAKPEVATAWLQSLSDHTREFPALRANQKFTGTCQAQFSRWWEVTVSETEKRLREANPGWAGDFRKMAESYVKKRKVAGNVYAHSWAQRDVGGVCVNKTWASTPDKFRAQLSRDVASRFHPVGCDTLRSVVDHEMGHQLDDLLGLHVDPNVVALYQEAKKLGMENEVSIYAKQNIKEFIAECWAEARNNPAPRRFSRRIEAIVRSRYAAQHP